MTMTIQYSHTENEVINNVLLFVNKYDFNLEILLTNEKIKEKFTKINELNKKIVYLYLSKNNEKISNFDKNDKTYDFWIYIDGLGILYCRYNDNKILNNYI